LENSGIGGVRIRKVIISAIASGTSSVSMANTPVIILAVNIRILLTGNVVRNAEILLFLSMYIWAAPIMKKRKIVITVIVIMVLRLVVSLYRGGYSKINLSDVPVTIPAKMTAKMK
jgi:hypothetical protein